MSKQDLDNIKKLEAFEENNSKASTTIDDSSSLYSIENRMIFWNRQTKDGLIPVPLCNFNAKITCEEIHDDGADRKTVFRLEGELFNGMKLPSIEVPAQSFANLNWVPEFWGARPIFSAGPAKKDHLRAAIQILSSDIERKEVFAHTGWRKIGSEYFYLNANGAIGAAGQNREIHVHLGDTRLGGYVLPDPVQGEELKKAIRASLQFLDLARPIITFPIYAGIFLAPLGEVITYDFSIFVVGPTGNQKSELTAIAQAHFGEKFNRLYLPGNWTSSANALEYQAFRIKDAIFVVDDFKPGGTQASIAELHYKAERLFRGQGNRAGRGRLTSSIKLRSEYSPRGLILSSGEDIPRGHSLRARLATLEVTPGEVQLAQLTELQKAAHEGTLAKVMASYLSWLAPQMDSLRPKYADRKLELRKLATSSEMHKRTPDIIAMLSMGWESFLDFALEKGALNLEERNALWQECWTALGEMGKAQIEHHASEDPTNRFFELLRSALISGQAHLADPNTGDKPPLPQHWGWKAKGLVLRGSSDVPEVEEWIPRGQKIGWVTDHEIWLEPEATFSLLCRMSRDQNEAIPFGKATLWKRLAEKGLIVCEGSEKRRNTQKRPIEGRRIRVLVIRNKDLLEVNDSSISETCPTFQATCPTEFKEVGQNFEQKSQLNQDSAPLAPKAPLFTQEGGLGNLQDHNEVSPEDLDRTLLELL